MTSITAPYRFRAPAESAPTGGQISPLRDVAAHTPVDFDSTLNPGLHNVFVQFAEVFDQNAVVNRSSFWVFGRTASPLSGPRMNFPLTVVINYDNASNEVTSAHTADALSAIDALQATLGLALKDVLAAAGVKKRTYYAWKKMAATSRPQTRSQGRLWEMLDTVETLSELVDQPVKRWLLADDNRLMLLKGGHFADLVRSAVPAGEGEVYRPSYRRGVEADIDIPVVPGAGGNVVTIPISR